MQLIREIDLKKWSKRKKAGLLFSSFGLMVLVTNFGDYLGVPGAEEIGATAALLCIVPTLIFVVVLHEGMHGSFFWLYTGKAEFGFKLRSPIGPVFWASSPGSLLPRTKVQAVALAPQILTAPAILISALVSMPDTIAHSLLLAAALNLGGGGLDLYFAALLSRYPRTVLVEDLQTGCKIYEPERSDNA